MRKPADYDRAEAREGGFKQPHAGPCILGFNRVQVEIVNGEQRAIFFLDIAEGEFKNFFRNQTERFGKDRYLRLYQNTEGKGLPYFKGIIGAIEEGNPGYKFDFIEATLAHKKIGGNLRDEEYLRTSDQTIGTNLRVAYLCSIKSVLAGEHKVMPIKKLAQQAAQRQPGEDDGFDQTPPSESYNQEQPMPF